MGKYAIFAISGEEFGIELNEVHEIIKPQKVNHCPGVPRYISGIFSLRGDVIPLMDMRKRLNVESIPNKEKIIIVDIYEGILGLLVDSVKEILNIEDEQIVPPPSIFKGLKPEYIKGIGKISQRLIIILNLNKLITPEEMTLLGDIAGSTSQEKPS